MGEKFVPNVESNNEDFPEEDAVFRPSLPRWFEDNYEENYKQLLQEELEAFVNDPSAYLGGVKLDTAIPNEPLSGDERQERFNLSDEELQDVAVKAKELLDDFDFELIGQKIQALFGNIGESPENLQEDFLVISQTMLRKMHVVILRKIIKNYLPRRAAILHRGSFKPFKDKLIERLPDSLPDKLTQMGEAGSIIKFILKDPVHKIEEIQANLERGIGGFEFDVRMDKNDEPVVAHSDGSILDNAPSLDELLSMVREALPEDPHEERLARRGLKLFLHIKIPSNDLESARKIMETLDRYNLTSQTYIQTGRPETLYTLDEAEESLKESNPDRQLAKYVLQTVPLGEASKSSGKIAMILSKLGLADRYRGEELRSVTSWVEEKLLLREWPPKGRIMDILSKHKGSSLAVPAGIYNRELLHKARLQGVGIHIDSFDDGALAEDMLSYDDKPDSLMTMDKNVIFPRK